MREDWIEVEFNDVLEIVSGKNQKQVLSEEGQYPISLRRRNNYHWKKRND